MTAASSVLRRVREIARESMATDDRPRAAGGQAPAADRPLTVWRGSSTAIVAAIALAFTVAFLINIYLLPHNSVVSSLYAIPVLVVAHLLSPRAIALTGATAVLVYIVNAMIEDRPLVVWPFGVMALLAVTYLAVLFARQKRVTARHAEEVEVANRRIQQFQGMVGHDLAGALTGVLGYAELLARNPEVAPTAAELRAELAIDATARRMRRLIDDLRDASSIGTGHFAVHKAPADLTTILQQVVAEQQLRSSGHRISLDAPAELRGVWDEERLGQLFSNLVTNAVAYSPQGSEVRLAVQQAGSEAIVSVADQGVGIAPEAQDVLFQPYFRLGGEQEVKGMGLGLYIVKAIADAHGSRIRVESQPGMGSTFYVTLPLDTDQAAMDTRLLVNLRSGDAHS